MPKFYGVGYMKVARWSDNPKAYAVWQGMLKRCYDFRHVRFNVYGGAGVVVSKRWLCFDNFIIDMPTLTGWDEDKFMSGDLQLDKDYKQRNKTCKVYSRKTCIWVSKTKNNRLQPSQSRRFEAVSPEGERHVKLNKAEFCRLHGLNPATVSGVLNGRGKTVKGWIFRYLD